MDQIKMGNFIATLRQEKGLTQAALGELVGVSNKTVSRWETGSCMPGAAMLQKLSETFSLSINELLSGERLPNGEPEAYRQKAEENLSALASRADETAENAPFSLMEQYDYWKKKWLHDHVALLVAYALLLLCYLAGTVLFHGEPAVVVFGVPALFLLNLHLRNKMMGYVEGKIYDKFLPDTQRNDT